MKKSEIIKELGNEIDPKLAKDLINEFIEVKKDFQTSTLSRTSIGKLIETVVQILEFLESGSYSAKPSVDHYLKNLESKSTTLDDDYRLVIPRIARSCYTLRNKRNIAHKGEINPNLFDLKFLFNSCQWLVTEFVRKLLHKDTTVAEKIVAEIQVPVDLIVEKIDAQTIIYGDYKLEEELVILLSTFYPEKVNNKSITTALDQRSKSGISNAIKKLIEKKEVHKNDKGIILTQKGLKRSIELRNK